MILAEGDTIHLRDLPDLGSSEIKSTSNAYSDSLEDIEREHILRILEESNWVIEGKKGASDKLK